RRQPAPSFPTPRVLGVDDFALRKRHTYGTILVALERWQPVALLSERTAEPVAQWLRAHPGVEVIARDRSSTGFFAQAVPFTNQTRLMFESVLPLLPHRRRIPSPLSQRVV